jgi:hypothetical protein
MGSMEGGEIGDFEVEVDVVSPALIGRLDRRWRGRTDGQREGMDGSRDGRDGCRNGRERRMMDRGGGGDEVRRREEERVCDRCGRERRRRDRENRKRASNEGSVTAAERESRPVLGLRGGRDESTRERAVEPAGTRRRRRRSTSSWDGQRRRGEREREKPGEIEDSRLGGLFTFKADTRQKETESESDRERHRDTQTHRDTERQRDRETEKTVGG